jgi:hypothetical protein
MSLVKSRTKIFNPKNISYGKHLMTRGNLITFITLAIAIAGGVGGYLGVILTGIDLPDEGDELMVNYVKDTPLMQITDYNFGGTFPKDVIYTPGESYVGVRLWFCYDDQGGPNRKLFLAAEKIPSFSFPTEQDEPFQQTLTTIDKSLSFHPTGSVDLGDALYHIRKNPEPNGKTVPISKNDVIKFSKAFKLKMDSEPSMKDYINYTYCFFIFDNDKDFEALLKPTGADYVRYYFGFDSKSKTNKIRVVLAAADANGKVFAKSSDIFLQKSIPPPPED